MSRRTERVAVVIRDVIAAALQRGELADPRLERFVSVTRVEVSDDFSVAKVFVSVMTDNPARRELSVAALQSGAGRLRGIVRSRLTTRQAPQLLFRLDESLRRSMETLTAIDEVMREYDPAESGPEPDGPDDAPAAAGGEATHDDDREADGR